MKSIIIYILLLFPFSPLFGQTWLRFNPVTNTVPAYVDCGNVKVTGNQITVECLSTGIGRYISKHTDVADLNYALSLGQFEITTGGNFNVVTYDHQLNCNYKHFAATYDGANIRIYLNGNLVKTQAASGNMATSDAVPMRIGQYAGSFWWPAVGASQPGIANQQGTGYIDEVRIWSVARSQAQIQANMSSNVVGQSGLVAYYRFNSLTNLQGNAAFNGVNINCTLGTTIPPFTTSWTVGTDWRNCGNWSNGVPYCPTVTAIIPNTANKPSITTLDPSAKTVTVQPDGRIDNAGGRLTVCP